MKAIITNGDRYAEEVARSVSLIGQIAVALNLASMAALRLSIWLPGRAVLGPLEIAKRQAEALARGDFTAKTEGDYTDRPDVLLGAAAGGAARPAIECRPGAPPGPADRRHAALAGRHRGGLVVR